MDVEYDAFATFYDSWVDLVPVTAHDVPFYVSVAASGDGPVVELGVGTGRVAVAVIASGRPVIGVDISPQMLARARERAEREEVGHLLTTEHADFREWLPPEPVELVIMPYRTLEDVLGAGGDLAAFLAHVATMLRPGGRFAFNIGYPNPERLARLGGVEIDLGEQWVDGRRVRMAMTNVPDASARVVHAEVRARVEGPNGHGDEHRWRFRLGWTPPGEVADAAAAARLEPALLQGSFLRPSAAIPGGEQVWILRKPE
jgi:SAM-dependent methyltransferase